MTFVSLNPWKHLEQKKWHLSYKASIVALMISLHCTRLELWVILRVELQKQVTFFCWPTRKLASLGVRSESSVANTLV